METTKNFPNKRRATLNQLKTIEAIRKIGKNGPNKRLEILKRSEAELDEKKQPSEFRRPKLPPKSFNAKIPLTLTKSGKQFIKEIKKNQSVKKLELDNGLKAGSQIYYLNKQKKKINLGEVKSAPLDNLKLTEKKNFGLVLEKNFDKDQLNISFNFPKNLKGLRIPSQKHQGDYQYQMKEIFSDTKEEIVSKESSVEDIVDGIMNPKQSGDVLNLDDIQLDNVAWYDFTDSRYVLDPEYLNYSRMNFRPFPGNAIKTAIKLEEEEEVDATDYLWFEQQLQTAMGEGIIEVFLLSRLGIWDPENQDFTYSQGPAYVIGIEFVISKLLDVLTSDIFADIANSFYSIQQPGKSETYWTKKYFFTKIKKCFIEVKGMTQVTTAQQSLGFYRDLQLGALPESKVLILWANVRNELISEFGEGEIQLEIEPLDEFIFEPESMPNKYSFDPFFPGSYNLGLRLVYRQEWRSLGNQRGEIVRTIPLAPKQSEKISTKIVKRSKISKNTELITSEESTTESNDTTKDSSELIKEASQTFGWNVEAELSQGWLGGKMSVSGGAESSTENQSKESSTKLSETMQKLATKTRTESKVIISTESESTFEQTTSSEIQNPNEEIPITCVYSKLQRQYEIFTSLAEVQEVVMVAELVPKPDEINYKWVKKHDWIIAKVLLDDSFREALNSISRDSLTPDQTGMTADLKGILNTTVSHLGSLASHNRTSELSISGVDMVQESQKNYLDASIQRAQRQRQNYLLETKRERLYKHIYENILHYCRAIWSNEDPQQRVLRYRSQEIKIPTEWNFFEFAENGQLKKVWDIDELYDEKLMDDNPNDEIVKEINGKFIHTDDYVYLADLINPAGPIGFFGNYALYYLKPEYVTNDVLNIFNILKLPYVYFSSTQNGDGELEYDYNNPVLMDPVLKKCKEDQLVNPVSDITIQTQQDEMIKFVPKLRLAYHKAKAKVKHPKTEEDKNAVENFINNYDLFREYYAEYKFREDLSRRFLVDTNNLVLDILPGEGSALEGFKLAHRGVDVLTAIEKKEKLKLENRRRKRLLKEGKLGDPDIDKLIIVSDNKLLTSLVACTDDSDSNDGRNENE